MKKRSAIKWIMLLSVCIICIWFVIPVLAEQKQEADVRITKVEGKVEVTGFSGRIQQRFANMKLNQGDRVCTEEDGSAWIDSESGERLRLDAGSRVELRTAGGILEYLLDAGNLYFDTEGQEENEVRIRTATAVLGAKRAVGWVKVTDRYHTQVYLLEGTLACAVTDPITGQVKQATLTEGSLAECVVYPDGQEDRRCDIIIRDISAEDLDGFVWMELAENTALSGRIQILPGMELLENTEMAGKRLSDARAVLSKHMEEMRQESQGYALLKDPVWTGFRDYAAVSEEADEAEQEISVIQGTDISRSNPFGGQINEQAVPVIETVMSPSSSEPETSSSKKKGGFSAPAPAENEKPDQVAPSTSTTQPKPAEPTEDQGLIIDGIAYNGPQGVIEVQEGGRIHVEGSDVFRNEGKLTSSGIIDSKVSNEGEFCLTGGSVVGVEQKEGTVSVTGGVVTGSSSVMGGTMQITGGQLAKVTQSEGILAVAGGTIAGDCNIEGGEFCLTGGTLARMVQSQGNAEISGGNITGDCIMEGGSLQITDGQFAKVTQSEGTLAVSGGTIAGDCNIEGGEFHLTGGTLARMVQNQGNAEISGGNITGDCIMEGGSLQIFDGQFAKVTQSEGILAVAGGTIAGDCSIEGGEFCLTRGTLACVLQSQGSVDISGGRVTNGYVVEGGKLHITNGKLTSIIQKSGSVSISGGSINNGCIVEGGRLELSGGTIWAGDAEAALTVQSGIASRSKDTVITAENADVYISGGILIGNGEGKSAIYADAGTVMVADAAKTFIKATEAFHTISGSKNSGWAVRYVETGGGDYVMGADSFDNPNGSSVIYVTKKETDGLMRLRRLSDDFLDVSNAMEGDILTLCGNVIYQTAPIVIAVTGGTAEAPVILDLNGRIMNLMDGDQQNGTRVEIKENAVWEIRGGKISARSLCSKDFGTAVISDTTIQTSEPLLAEGSSILTVKDSVISEGIGVSGSGTLQISDSDISGMVQGAQNGTIIISGSQANVKEIRNTGSSIITLSDSSKLTVSQGVYNTGTIQVEEAELFSDGGEITNEGTMNLTDGTITHVLQRNGVFHMASGTVTDGCTVTGGRFEMTDGTLRAGNADAALKADCSNITGTGQQNESVSEENASVWIGGGTVLGSGEKKAVDISAGNIWIAEDTIIKAGAAVNTITGDTTASSEGWSVQYAGYLMEPDKPPVIYVTKKDADGMMCLSRLEDDFEKVAQAEDGDVITLSDDVTEIRDDNTGMSCYILEVTGGSKKAPVTLDLNGKKLQEKVNIEYGEIDIEFHDAAVWEITNGKFEMSYGLFSAMEDSCVTLSAITSVSDEDGFYIMAEKSGNLTICESVLENNCEIISSVDSFVNISKSKLGGNGGLIAQSNSIINVTDSEVNGWGISLYENCEINVSNSSIIMQRGIWNEKGVLNISGTSIELTGPGFTNDRIYNDSGKINISDISMLNADGNIRNINSGRIEISGGDSGCELTAFNIDSAGELYISGCSIKTSGEITGHFDISNCELKDIGDITGFGSMTECRMENIDSIRWTNELNLSKCTMKDIKQMSQYQESNRVGSVVKITECMIDGIKLDGNGSSVYITNCDMVDRAEINGCYNMYLENSNIKLEKAISGASGSARGSLLIDGGSITCAESFIDDLEYMISVHWIEIRGDAVLDPKKDGIIPIKGTILDPGIIIGGNAKVIGGSSPALSFPMNCNSVRIEDHAELSSSCKEGTIVFFWNRRVSAESGAMQYRDINLEGGSVINFGQGCAVHWGNYEEHEYDDAVEGPYPDIKGEIQTEFRADIEDVFVKNDQAYIPDGYQVVKNDSYFYLCPIQEQISLEEQTDDRTEDTATEAFPVEEESMEEAKDERADLATDEEHLLGNSDLTEGEKKLDDESESAESGERSDFGAESTEVKEKSDIGAESEERDIERESAEGKGRPEAGAESEEKTEVGTELPEGEVRTEDTELPSSDITQPSEEGGREDAVLPSDDVEDLGSFAPVSPVGLLVQGKQLYICDNFSRKVFSVALE